MAVPEDSPAGPGSASQPAVAGSGRVNGAKSLRSPRVRPQRGEDPEVEPLERQGSDSADLCAAPEELAEERKLQQEREEAERAERARAGDMDRLLGKQSFQALQSLLNKSQLYTQFLAENMADAEQQQLESETAAAAQRKEGRGTKRTRRGAAADARPAGQALPQATAELCPGFRGDLRDYQMRGVRWLASLYVNGINGILADQMGLGKTVQTIGFLCHLRAKGILGPYLVLGPLSTLHNWVAEFERWAPDFPVVLYHGSKQDRSKLWAKRMSKKVDDKFPVVVTSFEIFLADIRNFLKLQWKYLVVDEGHRLKNHNCKLIRELRQLQVENKLLLTGTPLQNNLTELWSLLNFILPEAFSSLSDFESWFESMADDSGGDREELSQQRAQVVAKLHVILKPFLLRRVKTDVETSLPGKLELVLYAQQTAKQLEINEQLKNKTLKETLARTNGGASASMASLNNMLMQLRKNCNHPDLITSAFDGSVFYPPPEELVAQSGKLALLDRLLKRLLPAGHKTLIFSQMTSMLDILASYLEESGIQHGRLDGSIGWQERQEAIRWFSSDPECKVFLLSTRAGGLGINLTAADTCIIYDSDWNPQQDLQAMDRCHRIGQRRPVLVLRLASAKSVEGRLLARARAKLQLERLVIKKGAFLHTDDAAGAAGAAMSKEELLDVLVRDGEGGGDVALAESGDLDEATLDRLLDRTHLLEGTKRPFPDAGRGFEVVHQISGSGLLAGVE